MNPLEYGGTVGQDIEDALVEMRRISRDKGVQIQTVWNGVHLCVPPRATLQQIAQVAAYYRLALK